MPSVETADLAIIRGVLLQYDMLAAVSGQQLYYERESAQLVALDIAMQNTRRDIGLIVRGAARRHPPRVRSSTRYALPWTRSTHDPVVRR